jgi:hypothetical protein
MEIGAYGVRQVTLCKEQSSPERYLAYGDTAFRIMSNVDFANLGLRADAVETVADHTLDRLKKVDLGGGPLMKPSQVFFYPGADPVDHGSKDARGKVSDHVLIAGWLKDAPHWNYAGQPWVEDVHYYPVLDVDFIEQLYGPGGISTKLRAAMLPGLPADGNFAGITPLPFGDLPSAADGVRYASVGAFALAKSEDDWVPPDQSLPHVALRVELNCWHVYDRTGTLGSAGFYKIAGRGPAPDGWHNVFQPGLHGPFPPTVIDDCWWRYNPDSPDGGPPLSAGTQVLMLGTLWQDQGHDATSPWEKHWHGQGNYLEMHPPDWIHRLNASPKRRTAFALHADAQATPGNPTTGLTQGGVMRPGLPLKPAAPGTSPGKVDGIIDTRYVSVADVAAATSRNEFKAGVVEVSIDVEMVRPPMPPPGPVHPHARSARHTEVLPCNFFKATYIVDWNVPSVMIITALSITTDRSAEVLVQASDAASATPVSASVLIDGVAAGSTGTPFTHTFVSSWTWREERDPRGHPQRVLVWNEPKERLSVRAANYADAQVSVAWRNGSPRPDRG